MTEPVAPEGLAALQSAFGAAIATPLALAEEPPRLRLEDYPPAAIRATVGRGDRTAAERLGAYNRQYWFRLLTVLQEEYPLLRHLLGIAEFNRMASAYLHAHPSRSPLLRHLSDGLEGFLAGDTPWSRPELRQCAALEHAYIRAFDALELPPLDPSAQALSAPLALQPHLSLFREDWDLVAWRRRVWKDEDDAIAVSLSPSRGWWAIYRAGSVLRSEPLDAERYLLLERLGAGLSLADACDGLEALLDAEALARVAAGIQGWFARWSALGWFGVSED